MTPLAGWCLAVLCPSLVRRHAPSPTWAGGAPSTPKAVSFWAVPGVLSFLEEWSPNTHLPLPPRTICNCLQMAKLTPNVQRVCRHVELAVQHGKAAPASPPSRGASSGRKDCCRGALLLPSLPWVSKMATSVLSHELRDGNRHPVQGP